MCFCSSVDLLAAGHSLHLERIGMSLNISVSQALLFHPLAVSLPSLYILPSPLHQMLCFLYLEKHLLITEAFVQVSDCVTRSSLQQARRGCVTADRFSPVTHGPLSLVCVFVSFFVGLTGALLLISKVFTCIVM